MASFQTLTFDDASDLTADTETVSFLGTDYDLGAQDIDANRQISIGGVVRGVQRVRFATKLFGDPYTEYEIRLNKRHDRQQTPDTYYTFEYRDAGSFEPDGANTVGLNGFRWQVQGVKIVPPIERAVRLSVVGRYRAELNFDLDTS